MSSLLVLVHPGSLCGSADFNLGEERAGSARDAIGETLRLHRGPILVIDGELSDEMPAYGDLDTALKDCLREAAGSGFFARRIEGYDDVARDDDHFTRTIVPTVRSLLECLGPDHPVLLSGAWYHPDDGGGCVGAVRQVMDEEGFEAITISECCALLLDDPEVAPEIRPLASRP